MELPEPALAAAAALVGSDPLHALETLRGEYGAELAAAVWTQAVLRSRAVAKFGNAAGSMLFTAEGLEQSTRAPVAAHRAARLVGRASVVDLGCGIGGDLRALAAVVPKVVGVERDPATAACAAHNAPLATVVVGDALEVDLAGYDVVFADPARRTAGGRVFRPADYSPPWSWLRALLESRDTAAKVAPGIPHELVPSGVEAEWVSWEGELKEAALWSGSLATPGVGRRATVLRAPESGAEPAPAPMSGAPPRGAVRTAPPAATSLRGSDAEPVRAWTLVPHGAEPTIGPPLRWLHEPDPAVIRAGLVAEVADLVEGRLLDPTIAYVTTEADVRSPYTRRWEVLDALPFSLKRLRTALRERGVGRLDIKKRGSALDPERLRADLRLRGDEHAVVVLTRLGGVPSALICGPPVS